MEAYEAERLLLVLDVLHADGVRLQYRIVVSAEGQNLRAMEEPSTRRLPASCPERHIIADGSFCMYWAGDQSFAVADSVSAENWLNLLMNFLRLQRRAAKQRRWPNHDTWAHGIEAAHQQMRAERAAEKLGPEMQAAVQSKSMKASRDAGGTLRVLIDDRPFYSVWKSPNRLDRSGHRLTFVCEFGPKGRRKTSRGRRAALLEEMAQALVMWKAGETNFWTYYKERICCGTIDGCPLQKGSGELPEILM